MDQDKKRYDVSEIKSYRECQRKWKLSSRNGYHLRKKVTPAALTMGTVFHNSLHKLYVGKPLEEVENYVVQEMAEEDEKNSVMLRSMVRGYAKEVLPEDLEKFDVLDIEYRFEFTPFEALMTLCMELGITMDSELVAAFPDVTITGSIDMVVMDKETGEVWGVEHKSAINFREEAYSWMDEQPRLYAIAMILWCARKNLEIAKQKLFELASGSESMYPAYKYGGVYLNEVRKLVRAFDYKRTPLIYPLRDLYNFMLSFFGTVAECHKKVVAGDSATILPKPSFMQCAMCDFRNTCKEVMYGDVSLEQFLGKWGDKFAVRERDHLDEKAEE